MIFIQKSRSWRHFYRPRSKIVILHPLPLALICRPRATRPSPCARHCLDLPYTCIICRKMDYFSETLSMCSSEQRKLYTHRMALRCKGCIFLCSTLLHFNFCCCIKQMCLPLSFCHCILFSLFNNTTFVFLTKKK